MLDSIERLLENVIFRSRWLLAPFFLGLVFVTLILLLKFSKELIHLGLNAFTLSSDETIISLLTLVDTTLIACLLFIIILSGYESFVSKLDLDGHVDRPAWMGKVGFSDLKLKLIGAIVAISAVELLKTFIDIKQHSNTEVAWRVGIHLTFVLSGVLFALTDWISSKK